MTASKDPAMEAAREIENRYCPRHNDKMRTIITNSIASIIRSHGVLVPTETLREVRDAIGFFTQSCERGNLAADADRIYKAMRQVVPKLTEIEAKNES